MEQLLTEIRNRFRQAQNPEKAIGMENYMKNNFPFLGLLKLDREVIQKQIFSKFKIQSAEQLFEIVFLFWEEDEREFQYCAIDLLEKYKKLIDENFVGHLEILIISKSWWDTVDILASKFVAFALSNNAELRRKYFDSWKSSDNLWLKRCAIIFQLKYKSNTNTHLLSESIILNSDSREFFIQKAIGWALREYAKTNPDWVINFIKKNQLKPLSRREALKHLFKDKKTVL